MKAISNMKATQRQEEAKSNNRDLCMKLKESRESLHKQLDEIDPIMKELALKLPNYTHPDVPRGDQPRVIKITGGNPPTPDQMNFQPKSHAELASGKLFDFESGAKVCGSKFYYTKGAAAFLELALVNWQCIMQPARDSTLTSPPMLPLLQLLKPVDSPPETTITQPTKSITYLNSQLCLVGTSEITLGGIYADTIIDNMACGAIRTACPSRS